MHFALFQEGNSKLYEELFERDRKELFPNNTFPPNPKDKVALEILDDILDFLPWYYQYGDVGEELPKYKVCRTDVTDTMQLHARIYGLRWVPYLPVPDQLMYYLAHIEEAQIVELDE